MVALHEAMIGRGLESPYAERLRDWEPDPAHAARITTRVPCAEYFAVRDRALLAHATQVDPEGPGSACRSMCTRGLADRGLGAGPQLVPVETPEEDLFAGIAVPAEE